MATMATSTGETHRVFVSCHPIRRANGGYEFDFEDAIPTGMSVRLLKTSSAGWEIPLKRIGPKKYRFDSDGLGVFLNALRELNEWKCPTRLFAIAVGDMTNQAVVMIPTPFPPYTGPIGISNVRAISDFMDRNGATYGGTYTAHWGRVLGPPVGDMRFLENGGVIETDPKFWGMGCIGFVGSVLGFKPPFGTTHELAAANGFDGAANQVAGLPDRSSGESVEKYFMDRKNRTEDHSYLLWGHNAMGGGHVVIVHQNVVSEFNLKPKNGYNENTLFEWINILGRPPLHEFHVRLVA